jgi:hypothetical protein
MPYDEVVKIENQLNFTVLYSLMRSVKELRSPIEPDELQTSSGNEQGTLRGGLTAVKAERSSNGDLVPGDAA